MAPHNRQRYGEFNAVAVFRLVPLLVPGLILALSAGCSAGAKGRPAEGKPAAQTLIVKVSPVETREFRRNVEAVGSLFPDDEVTVSAEVEGRVEEVLVDVGDPVAKGQPMVRLSPVELQLALDQQRAALRQARARLGVPPDGPDLKDVRDAAEVKKAAADLDDARKSFERADTLMQQGLIPQQAYDQAEARHKTARAAYDLAIQAVENQRAQVTQLLAAVALAQKKLSDAVIRAPFAGQIRERAVTQGQYLKIQAPVMVVVNTDPLKVRLKIPEKMAGWVRAGQDLTLTVEAWPGRPFTARTSRINPSVDPQTRSFEVEALLANPGGQLKPGFFVKASLPSERLEKGLFIPASALRYAYGIYKVYTVEGNTLKERDVKIGEKEGDRVEIVEGLAGGQTVAIPAPGQALRDQAAVKVER
ncbi:MAG: efflux RND transporter periplasmic adaptor subunit [Acidobacteria bacterium]|nr:efflux RND transporter periplasmic adaptor subunit [Acidobacteriota bacterium]